jgi:hypothetical protein
MTVHKITARLVDGQAQVQTAGDNFLICRSDEIEATSRCLIDYLSVALGS